MHAPSPSHTTKIHPLITYLALTGLALLNLDDTFKSYNLLILSINIQLNTYVILDCITFIHFPLLNCYKLFNVHLSICTITYTSSFLPFDTNYLTYIYDIRINPHQVSHSNELPWYTYIYTYVCVCVCVCVCMCVHKVQDS